MSTPLTCPSRDDLQRLLEGVLPSSEAERLEEHLLSCPHCTAAVPTVQGGDTLAEAIRSLGSAPATPESEPVEQLITRLESLCAAEAAAAASNQTAQWPAGRAALDAAEGPRDILAPPQGPGEIGRLGGYRVLEILGKGGMGVVLLAHDPHLDRRVALKAMLPGVAARPGAKERFLREARLAAGLHNDHIVTIHQVGEDRGVPFLAMEYLQGTSLDRLLRAGGQLSLARLLRIGREIAHGLAAAHSKGLIHRDIKPGNIWLDETAGRCKILDFGLARAESDDANLTQSGAVVGTPAYMSPEQASGDKAVDARADLFSLGCILYRMCTGDVPFKGETTMGVLMALGTRTPPPPRQLNANVPEALSDLIVQLLQKDPDRRPRSAREVITRLQAIEQNLDATVITTDAPASASPPAASVETADLPAPPPPLAPAPQPRRRRRWLVAAAALAVLIPLGAWLAQTVLNHETPHGTLVVQIDGKDVEARFKNGTLQLYGADGKLRYTITPSERNREITTGKYRVRVVGADGIQVDTEEFTLAPDGRRTVRVFLEKRPPMPPEGVAVKPVVDPERRAAEWVLARGGLLELAVAGKPAPVKVIRGPLPKEPFRVVTIRLENAKAVDDKALDTFRDLAELKYLILHDPVITDAGLARFAASPGAANLLDLRLPRSRISDAGLAGFQKMRRLEYLELVSCPSIGDAGLKHVRHLPLRSLHLLGTSITSAGLAELRGLKLHYLNLNGCKGVDDAGLAHLKETTTLHTLYLYETRVGNAGLAHLARNTNLSVLGLGRTRVTDAGLDTVAGFKKLTSLDLSGLLVTDAGVAKVANLPVLEYLCLTGTRVTDAGLRHLGDLSRVTTLNLSNLAGVSDQGLDHLRSLRPLTTLVATGSKVTADGAKKLAAALPRCTIEWTGGTIPGKDVDRAVAESVLRAGGEVWVQAGPQRHGPVTAVEKLPKQAFQLTSIHYAGDNGRAFGDRMLESFRDLPNLQILSLPNTAITNAGLARFLGSPAAKTLVVLIVDYTAIGDAGLIHLAKLTRLQRLSVTGCPKVGDATLQLVKGLPLGQVGLSGTSATNAGLAHLRGKKLRKLDLSDCPRFDDRGLVHLKELTTLESLNLSRTRAGDTGVKGLLKNTDLTDLRLSGTRVTEAGLAGVAALRKLEVLWLSDLPVTDAFVAKLKDRQGLKTLLLNNTLVTDAALEHLRGLPALISVDVRATKVTADAATRLSAALPACGITTDTDYFPAWAADKAAVEKLRSFRPTLVVRLPGNKSLRVAPDAPLPSGPYRLVAVDFLTAKRDLPGDFVPRVVLPAVGDLSALNTLNLIPLKVPVRVADLNRLADLPVGQTLAYLSLPTCELNGETLAALKRFPKLADIYCSGKTATDDVLARLSGLPGLVHLNVTDVPRLGEAGRKAVTGLPLAWLGLGGSKAVDRDLCRRIAAMPKLVQLYLDDSTIGDEGLAELAQSRTIYTLTLHRTAVSDAGLAHLAGLKSLKTLLLPGTRVTKAGVDRLAVALPQCAITWNGGVVGPVEPTVKLAQWVRSKGGELFLTGVGYLTAKQPLPDGLFVIERVQLFDYRLTDADLELFRNVPSCIFIRAYRTELTDAGLEKLSRLPQAYRMGGLSVSSLRVTSAGFPYLLGLPNLTELHLTKMRVRGADLAHLRALPGLTALDLGGTNFTNVDLGHVAGLGLKHLNLSNTAAGDAGLKLLAKTSTLQTLKLYNTKVADAGLEHLIGLKGLTFLELRGARVSAAAVAKLSAALPGCEIQADAGLFPAWAADKAAVEKLRPFQVVLRVHFRSGESRYLTPDMPVPPGPYRLVNIGETAPAAKIPADWAPRVLLPAAGPLPALTILDVPPQARVTAEDLNRLAETPAGKALMALHVSSCELTPQTLAAFKRFPKLANLTCSGKSAADETVARLAELPAVEYLALVDLPALGDRGRATLTGLPLQNLRLDGGKALDADFCRRIAAMPKLFFLRTLSSSVDDNGLTELARSRTIRELNLYGCPITDAGLAKLVELKTLTRLHVKKTRVTKAGVEKLAAALPRCWINWDGGEVGPLDSNRKLALWVQAKGGELTLVGRKDNVRANEPLPDGPFAIERVNLKGYRPTDADLDLFRDVPSCVQFHAAQTAWTDAGLEKLSRFPHAGRIAVLTVFSPKVTSAGLTHLPRFTGLHGLDLNSARLTNADLIHVQKLSGLISLSLAATKVSDESLGHLNGLKLNRLNLFGTGVTDAGLKTLARHDSLHHLGLDRTAVTDAGLEHLTGLKNLKDLTLRGTKVTAAAVTKLSAALPACEIKTDVGEFPAWAADLAAVEKLRPFKASLGVRLPSGEVRLVLPNQPMPPGPYQVTRMDFNGARDVPRDFVSRVLIPAIAPLPALGGVDHLPANAPVTAKDLHYLAGQPAGQTLQYLHAQGCELTAPTLTEFKRFPRLHEVICSGKPTTDAVLTRLPELPALRHLFLSDLQGVGAAGLKALTGLPLTGVGLRNVKAADRDLCRRLAAMPALTYLALLDSPVQDEWLADLADSATIRTLYLTGVPVTDAGLERLARLKPLTDLIVNNTRVTKPGVVKLAAALPRCKITWAGGTIGPLDLNHKLAQWVQSKGGELAPVGGKGYIQADQPLPDGPFAIQAINLRNLPWTDDAVNLLRDVPTCVYLRGPGDLTDKGFEALSKLPHASQFAALALIRMSRMTPAGWAHLTRFSSLYELSLANTSVTDVEVVHLRKLPRLTQLSLQGTKVTNAGLAHLKGLKLNQLILFRTGVTDEGLKTVGKLDTLQHLGLGETNITDDGLTHLTGLKKLTYLNVEGTKVTLAGVKRLMAALPTLQIACTYDGKQDADRQLAEWVLGKGGTVTLWGSKAVAKAADLPAGPLLVGRVAFLPQTAYRVTDADLERFRAAEILLWYSFAATDLTDDGLRKWSQFPNAAKVWFLSVNSARVTDAGLAHLQRFAGVRMLGLGQMKLTDDSLKHLAGLTELSQLFLQLTPVGDKGLIHLTKLPRLKRLSLNGTKVTNAGLETLGQMAGLQALALDATEVSDVGLAKLAALWHLQELSVKNTRVTAAGVQKLAAVLPRCRIEWAGGTIAARDVEREVAGWVIKAGGTVDIAGPTTLANVKALERLPQTPFQVTAIRHSIADKKGERSVDNKALDTFRHLAELRTLQVVDSSITSEGLARFLASRAAANLTHLHLSRAWIGDAGLTSLHTLKRLERLELGGCNVGDGCLKQLPGLPLHTIILWETGITDVGLAHLKPMTELRSIDLRDTAAGDTGLACLAGNTELEALHLTGTRVTNAGIDTLAGFKKLTTLELQSIPVTNDGLARLKDLTRLKTLWLNQSRVTDAGLSHLRHMKALTTLYLGKTGVTKAGVQALAAALPRCRITWEGGLVAPRAAAAQPKP